MRKYQIEIRRTISTTVDVEAESASAAIDVVNKHDFPLPPRNEWDGMKDWEYAIVAVDGVTVEDGDDPEDDEDDDGDEDEDGS